MKHFLLITAGALVMIVGCKKDNKSSVATISTSGVAAVTSTSAQITGDIMSTGGSNITKSGICWDYQNNPTVADSVVTGSQAGTGSFTVSLSNLNANTMYYVRAFAINGSGTAYGAVDSFQTAAGLPTVTTTAISNVAPLSAQSGGNVTNSGGANVTARGLCWSTSAQPTIANFKTSDSSGTGSFVDSLTDLASQTVYYVRAYATNSFGTAYGNQITFTASSANTVSDIDGNVYPYVTLGLQSWMTMNLKTRHFQNGDTIQNGLTGYKWKTTTTGAYSFPNGDSTKNAVYGKLYDVYVVNDTRNACPIGWHIPTDGDWETLEYHEGMAASDTGLFNNRGTIGGLLLVGGASGLNLQEAGLLFPVTGGYYYFGTQGYYWSSTPGPSGNYYRAFNQTGSAGPIYRQYGDYGMSIRCVKN